MSHRTLILVGVILGLSGSWVSCTSVTTDEPARFAEEWLIALSTRDALKADGLTCKTLREELRSGQLIVSSFVTLAEIFIGPIEVEVDVSEVDFTTLEQKGDLAIVQARGEIRSASLGTVDSEDIDERWFMQLEDDQWRWCGSAETETHVEAQGESCRESDSTLPPDTFAVCANQGWQDTGVVLEEGDQVSIGSVSGQWFEDPPGQWHDASGGPGPWICAQPECHEPLHDFPKYALIGKIGNDAALLKIGNGLDFVAASSGPLYLRPNYGDEDIPIHNPQGAVTVRIIMR